MPGRHGSDPVVAGRWRRIIAMAARRQAWPKRDAALMPEIARVWEKNFGACDLRKVWRQPKREGHDLARGTVARLMRGMGLRDVIRGKPARTTISDKAAPCPLHRGAETADNRSPQAHCLRTC